jgi:hypothetical protein
MTLFRNYKLITFCLLIIVSNSLVQAAANQDAPQYLKNAIGLTLGVPQTIAVSYDRTLNSKLAARIHIGSVILFSSIGSRVQWGQNDKGIHYYIFAGLTLINNSIAEDYGDPEGTAGYLWFGPGLAYRDERWIAYTEVSALLGSNDNRGLGDNWIFPFAPAISAGFLIRF